ncbi:MAG: pentapeptide repeat-containing protein [archaeon]
MKLDELTSSELISALNDKSKAEELLTSYKETWNRLMSEKNALGERIKLSGIDLQGKDLTGLDFSAADIDDSDFSGSDLSDAVFSGATILESRFAQSKFYRTEFDRTKISRTDMAYTSFKESSIGNAYMTGSVNLFGAYVTGHHDAAGTEYKTHPSITVKGYSEALAYEEKMEKWEEDEQNSY